MSKFLNDLRAFANREDDVFTNESTEIDGFDFENDEQFMQECYAACLPSIIQNELLGESAGGSGNPVRGGVFADESRGESPRRGS